MNDVNSILREIRSACERHFGDELVGVYVHGSIAFGCFEWSRSDVDFLVVVSKSPSIGAKASFIRELLEITEYAPPKGLEMSVVLEKDCREFKHPCHYELHFSNGHLERMRTDIEGYCRDMQGEDPDLAAHFTVTKAVGFPLCGKPIAEVFGSVPREDYLASILCDVESAKNDILRDPVYMTLNLCRVCAALEESAVLSKKQGGKWGMENLPEEYAQVVRGALDRYVGGVELDQDATALTRFAGYMLGRIANAQ